MEEAFSDFSSIYYFTLRREKFEGTICNLAEFSQLQVNLTFSVSFSFLQQVQVNRSDKEAATTALRQQQVTRKQQIVERKVKGAQRKLRRLPVMIVVMIVPVMIVEVLAIVRVCWRCTLMHKM